MVTFTWPTTPEHASGEREREVKMDRGSERRFLLCLRGLLPWGYFDVWADWGS